MGGNMDGVKMYFSDSEPFVTSNAEASLPGLMKAEDIKAGTIYHSTGVWSGEFEYGFVLEVLAIEIAIPELYARMVRIAAKLAKNHKQDSVLVTTPTGYDFVGAGE